MRRLPIANQLILVLVCLTEIWALVDERLQQSFRCSYTLYLLRWHLGASVGSSASFTGYARRQNVVPCHLQFCANPWRSVLRASHVVRCRAWAQIKKLFAVQLALIAFTALLAFLSNADTAIRPSPCCFRELWLSS